MHLPWQLHQCAPPRLCVAFIAAEVVYPGLKSGPSLSRGRVCSPKPQISWAIYRVEPIPGEPQGSARQNVRFAPKADILAPFAGGLLIAARIRNHRQPRLELQWTDRLAVQAAVETQAETSNFEPIEAVTIAPAVCSSLGWLTPI